jgi:hypothetical protein
MQPQALSLLRIMDETVSQAAGGKYLHNSIILERNLSCYDVIQLSLFSSQLFKSPFVQMII